MKIEVWQRADGLIEVEWQPSILGMTRYRTNAEVDAFLAGVRAANAMAQTALNMEVDDRRPVQPAPAPRRRNVDAVL